MDRILLFMALIASGYAVRLVLEVGLKKPTIYEALINILVKIVYYFLIPLAFVSIFLNRGLQGLDAYVFCYFSLFLSLIYFYTKRHKNYHDAITLFLLIGFPNSVFLGFPVVDALLGRVYVAAVFGVITVVLNILVPDLVAKRRLSIGSILKSTGLIGFIAGTAGHYLLGDFALTIHRLINWSNPLLSYVATLTMGMRIPIRINYTSQLGRELMIIGLFRFMIAPLVALLFSTITGFSRADQAELVLVSAMPPAVMNAIIAEKYGWRPQVVALLIALLTILFLVIVFPVLVIIYGFLF